MSTDLVSCFQLLNLVWRTATSVLKTKGTNIVGDDNRTVLWDSNEFHETFNKH
jgi:hypothetical protein